MIKLAISIVNDNQGDWKQAPTLAHEKLNELQREADAFQAEKMRYIRPILLAQV